MAHVRGRADVDSVTVPIGSGVEVSYKERRREG